MADRLLRKQDIAAMLGTSPDVAASILRENGCAPIYFGRGRSRGYRWLKSAVEAVIASMHAKAQPKPRAHGATGKVAPRLNGGLNLSAMNAAQLYEDLKLTANATIQ